MPAAHKRKLTALMVTRLQPAARRMLLWDTVQRGLVLAIEPSGYRAFKLIYNYRNRTRWYHIGAADALGLADARKFAAKLMLEVLDGKDPQAERRAERGTCTFKALFERYLDYSKARHKSWKQSAALIERNVLPRWGGLAADDIKRADAKALLRSMSAPITANQTLAVVSAVFSWAMREEILATNPCKLVERNETKDRERVLSASELKLVWSAFDELNSMVATALKLITLLGQRPGEVSHMRYEHLKDGWWEMPGAASEHWPGTKNGNGHRVFINKPAKELIDAFPKLESSGYVLTTSRGNAVRDLDVAMRNICSKLNIERATPHDLRRTAASAIAALHGREAMDRILNHKRRNISSVYDRHSYSVEDQRIMENVGSHIIGLVHGAAANVVAFTQQR